MSSDYLPVIQNCDSCGACCRTPSLIPVGFQRGWREGVPSEWLTEDARRREMGEYLTLSGCPWLNVESGQCIHYEHRPEICRNTPQVGDEHCRNSRKIHGIDP